MYRARDPRLGREVAVKVLPSDVAADAGRLKRFEKEARSASALNHPNIVTIYEIGSAESLSYIAMELVEGKTLRELLYAGPLPVKRVLQVAAQITDGLARAHEAGIVHRDLKPENVMVTKDGRVKILDFGLAKLNQLGSGRDEGSHLPTETGTSPGMILGTVGYMSPEQASGLPLDFRSDQFSFGSILYEMLTGKRAFARATGAQMLAAVIQDEPEPIRQARPEVAKPLQWIVEQCLSKEPRERYAATQDLARELGRLLSHFEDGVEAGQPLSRSRTPWLLAIPVAILLAAVALWLSGALQRPRTSAPSFRRLTFRQGGLGMARFAPDGQTVIYSATWKGGGRSVYLLRIGSPESRLLFTNTDFYSVSDLGELAIMPGAWIRQPNLLARVPMEGGAPREVVENIAWANADWAPGGKGLAVIRSIDGRNRLEFPIGRVIYETDASIGSPRFSPDGRRIAFFLWNDSVLVIKANGTDRKVLSAGWGTTEGVPCWARNGKEVWFTAARPGESPALRNVNLSRGERLVARLPGHLELYDLSAEGRVLLAQHSDTNALMGLAPHETQERDLSWLDIPEGVDLSSDGKTILFNETGEGGGPAGTVYLRETDGSDAKRLGEGEARALSPDRRWAIVASESKLWLVPTGAGEPGSIAIPGLERFGGVDWLPDGNRIVFSASERGKRARLYVQALSGGPAQAITPEGVAMKAFGDSVSPDGRLVIGLPVDLQPTQHPEQRGSAYLYPLAGGQRRLVPGLQDGELPVQWSSDGKSIYVYKRTDSSGQVWLLDTLTGARRAWKEIGQASVGVRRLLITPDGSAYAYDSRQIQSGLFLVEGLN